MLYFEVLLKIAPSVVPIIFPLITTATPTLVLLRMSDGWFMVGLSSAASLAASQSTYGGVCD